MKKDPTPCTAQGCGIDVVCGDGPWCHQISRSRAPAPEWLLQEIDLPNFKCSVCKGELEMGDLVYVVGKRGEGGYTRYHDECWPW